MKLNQILAVEKGVKNKSYEEFTTLHKASQRKELYDGRYGTYSPVDEEGERFPDERQNAQLDARDVLNRARELRSEYFDLVLQKDLTNLSALADVEVDGTKILSQVPVTYLLFLEKELSNLESFVAKMPTLDAAENWTWNEGQAAWMNEPAETAKTKKVPKAHVLYEATENHPAQVQQFTEDVVVGYWKRIKYSNALTVSHKRDLTARLRKLIQAVKTAREAANSTPAVSRPNAGDSIFDYLLGEEK